MENRGSASTEEDQKYLSLFVSCDVKNYHLFFDSQEVFKFTSDQTRADLVITADQKNFILKVNNHLAHIPLIFIPQNKTILYKFLNSFNQLVCNTHRKSELCNIFSQKIYRFCKPELNQKTKWPRNLQILQIRPADLRSLPETLLSIPEFSNYHSCQILIHEKGSSHAFTYFSGNERGTKSFRFSVNDFNYLFNLIRKSKHKLFDQSQIQSSHLQLLGPFLAKSISLKAYNIVIVISRNELLMPIPTEQSIFERIMEPMPLILGKLLFKESNIKKDSFYRKCFFEFPIQLKLFNYEKNLNIRNRAAIRSEHLTGSELLQPTSKKISNGMHVLFYGEQSNFLSAFDYFHKQRISLLGELFNTLKHELSNPLFGLKLACDLMGLHETCTEFAKIMSEINLNVKKCQDIIDGFSKLYNQENVIQSVDIFTTIQEALVLAKSEVRLIKKNIISKYYNQHMPLFVRANSTWVIQILFNLLVNSSQAMKDVVELHRQEITLRVTPLELMGKVEILVSDNGPGINDDIKNKLFSPFFTTKTYGTGLGLAISKNLATQLGGELDFYNNQSGKGVTFRLLLPLSIQ